MMEYKKPIDHAKVYGMLGFLLGTLGSAAVFMTYIGKMFYHNYELHRQYGTPMSAFPLVFLAIIAICSFAGTGMGLAVGVLMKSLRKSAWATPVLLAPVAGLIWAVFTGGSGGLPFIIIGAVVGAAFASPIGIVGFTAFAALYEPRIRRREYGYGQAALMALMVSLPLAVLMLIFEILTVH
jgi:hypothetical protein